MSKRSSHSSETGSSLFEYCLIVTTLTVCVFAASSLLANSTSNQFQVAAKSFIDGGSASTMTATESSANGLSLD